MARAAPRILILRRDNIGDLVCTTPLIDALRAQLPQAWIGALVTTYNAEVLARNPALDAVYAYEKLKHRSSGILSFVKRRIGQVARLRSAKLDWVLVPVPAPHTLKLARSLRPREVLAAAAVAPEGLHEVERTFELGRGLGISGKPGPVRIFPDPEAIAALKRRHGAGPFTALHISARRPAQRWPFERYAALARELAKEAALMLLWAPGAASNPGHPGDDEAALRVSELAANEKVHPVPTRDLTTLIAALALADRVVCPDGGAMHLAAALGKPVVALFGDSPVERWRPWGVPHRIVRPASGELAELGLEPVLEALGSLREQGRSPNTIPG